MFSVSFLMEQKREEFAVCCGKISINVYAEVTKALIIERQLLTIIIMILFALMQGVPKQVHTKLEIVIRQVSADSERASFHRENKPSVIKISEAFYFVSGSSEIHLLNSDRFSDQFSRKLTAQEIENLESIIGKYANRNICTIINFLFI